MKIEKLIEQLQKSADFEDYPVVASFAAIIEKKYLREAATALEQLQAENDRLQAELEKAEAVRKKQADILYELRGQKYEQTTAIDQLRAENDRLKELLACYCDMCIEQDGVLWCQSGDKKCNYCLSTKEE